MVSFSSCRNFTYHQAVGILRKGFIFFLSAFLETSYHYEMLFEARKFSLKCPNPVAIAALFYLLCHVMTILLLRLNESVKKESSLLSKCLCLLHGFG